MKKLKELVITASNQQISQKNRHEAFGELLIRFQDAAFEWAYAILDHPEMAQDAVQEGFVVAYQRLDQLRQPFAFPGWLKQIIVSQCHRLVRGKKVATSPIESTTHLVAREPEPSVLLENLELQQNVLRAIQALPEHEQVVTQMFYLNEYSQKEIAKRLQVPLTTVKKRLQYARQNLKVILVTMLDTLAPQSPTPVPVPIPIPVSRQQPSSWPEQQF